MAFPVDSSCWLEKIQLWFNSFLNIFEISMQRLATIPGNKYMIFVKYNTLKEIIHDKRNFKHLYLITEFT